MRRKDSKMDLKTENPNFEHIETNTDTTTKIDSMEKYVVEAIDTAAPTNDEQNKKLCVAVELDDTGGGGDRDKGPVII